MGLKFQKMLRMTQEQLLNFAYNSLLSRNYNKGEILKTEDYIYAEGDIPVLLVAHCDIVHKNPPETIVYDPRQRIMWSPSGIGGDDRCGVYAILKICEEMKPCVLFTTEEEKDGIGVRKFTEDILKLPIKFIIEIDRRGNNQVVFYDCGNEEFQKYILGFGFDLNYGSYSDVSTLSTKYDIAGCNLSAGYYNEHRETEHIYIDHLENTIAKVKEILKDEKNHKFWDCQEKVYTRKYTGYYHYYDDMYDDYYYYKTEKKEKKAVKEIEEPKETETEDDFDYSQVYKEILEMEEDFYSLTRGEWYDKYHYKKPKDVTEIYFINDK